MKMFPNTVDESATIDGLKALLKAACDPQSPAIGLVYAVIWADQTIDFGRLGLAKRNTDKAYRAAGQLTASLTFDEE